MFRSAVLRRSFVARFVFLPLWQVLRVILLAFACAGPPMPPHEIRGRTPAVQHEAARKR
jgi:hypothetical protein